MVKDFQVINFKIINKAKVINRKDGKDFMQRSQGTKKYGFNFAYFAIHSVFYVKKRITHEQDY
jgi:hypothetical protein